MRHKQAGFTLTELAVVLFIVALLIGGMLLPLAAQDDLRRTQETQNIMADIREALLGYASARGRLPCPDQDLDGLEDTLAPVVANNIPVAGQSTQTFSGCTNAEGGVPFATLGVQRSDSWNRRFRYRVTAAFTQAAIVWSGLNATGNQISATPGFSLNQIGDITVQTRGDNPATGPIETKFLLNVAVNIPAIVISHGKNGFGATNDNGTAMPAPPAVNVDETANANAVSAFKLSRLPSGFANPCSDTVEDPAFCEFDDLIVWLSPNILFNRMIAAGRLP